MVKEIVTTYHPAGEKVVGMEKRKKAVSNGEQIAMSEAAATAELAQASSE